MSTSRTVFYSWQSDLPNKTNRGFIADALNRAIKKLQRDDTIVEAERPDLQLDRDTAGVPGSPDIAATILQKIDGCAIFIADISTLGKAGPQARATPNPNVLFELGYAWRALGDARVLLVSNVAFSGNPQHPEYDLPFDLRGKRLITYMLCEEEEKAAVRDQLVGRLAAELREMLPLLQPIAPRAPIAWREWLGAGTSPPFFQQEFRLDWDRDGQVEPVFVVGTLNQEGRPIAEVLVFRYTGGGWRRIRVDPINTFGEIHSCSVELRHCTDVYRQDLVLSWNCGGTGSWLVILRWNGAWFDLADRDTQGLSGPFVIDRPAWTLHNRYWVTFRQREGEAREEVVEHLNFDMERALAAPDVAPLVLAVTATPSHSVWVQRIWRWDEQVRQFVLTNQQVADGPPQD